MNEYKKKLIVVLEGLEAVNIDRLITFPVERLSEFGELYGARVKDLVVKVKELERTLNDRSYMTFEDIRTKFHTYSYNDEVLYEIIYDPERVAEYAQGLKDYTRGYIDIGLLQDTEDISYDIPTKYLTKP